jgi:hypothetical protein
MVPGPVSTRVFSQDEGLPPSVRHWLGRISKAGWEHWEKVTRSWPEPWRSRRGALEAVRGQLRVENGPMGEFTGWLWFEPRSEPLGIDSWGGGEPFASPI